MTNHDITGAVHALLLTRTRMSVAWCTVERDWPPERWPATLTGLRPMLVGCVSFANADKFVSAGVGRFGLS